jgi:acetyl esterase/lipase
MTWGSRAAAARQSSKGASDPYAVVDPELLPALKGTPTKTVTGKNLAEGRKWPVIPPLPKPAPQPFEKRIPGPAGAPELRVVIVDHARGTKGRPVFFHMHGGGYVAGFAGQDPPFLQTVAQSCGCLVVSVDYRLAPETHFPGSLEDNYSALRWVYNNADSLGVDRKRIAVGGESAGGGHAAQLAIAARDRKEIPILFQLLIYPMLDDRTGSVRSDLILGISCGIPDRTALAGPHFWECLQARTRCHPAPCQPALKISAACHPRSYLLARLICLSRKTSNTLAA